MDHDYEKGKGQDARTLNEHQSGHLGGHTHTHTERGMDKNAQICSSMIDK